MASKNKPYEQFGPYVLFRKLESDSLSELWRAAPIDGNQLGPLVALRRFIGGNRDAIAASARSAREIVPLLTGTSFARNQVIDDINGTAFIAHEYSGGRSLRHIVEKAHGGSGVQPNPIPLDQAIVIAEKIALSLATTADLRFGTTRLSHGALLPQFVWISDDGEIRVAGQQLAAGLIASLKDARFAAEFGRYFAPESHATGMQSKGADIYALGGLLYLLTTGLEPPDATTASAFTQSIRAAKAMNGGPIPDEIRAVLDKSLILDPTARFAAIADMKQAISAIAHGGKYSATTFNLAFYVSTLLKKEMEGEAIERDKEMKVNVAPYLEALAPPSPAVEAPGAAPTFASLGAPKKSRAPLAVAAVIVLAAIGAGAFFMLRTQALAVKTSASGAKVTSSAVPPPKPAIVAQPLVAAAPPAAASTGPMTVTSATSTAVDDAARKKAFEAAVEQKLQEEMMKLQADYTKKLQQQQSKQAPVQVATASSAPPPALGRQAPADDAPSAAQLDQQRVASRQEPLLPQTAPATVAQTQSAPPVQQPAAPAAALVPTVHEGDVVDVAELDTPPHFLRQSPPRYPPMAARQRVETVILLTALVNENGDVLDVKVLRGDPRFGFQDEAVRAAKSTKFTSPMKDGKRVKVWFPIPVHFKL
jgi:TonB family protein